MKIFGDVDKDKDGKLKSDYPAYYFETHTDELEESAKDKKRKLEDDTIPQSEKGLMKSRMKQEEERLAKINDSRPQLSGTEKDEIAKARKELGSSIAPAMFSKTDMQKGTADPHEEARRLSSPIIEVKSDKQAELIKACGIKIKDGKITRGEAERVWKITGKLLGESTNTDTLRKG